MGLVVGDGGPRPGFSGVVAHVLPIRGQPMPVAHVLVEPDGGGGGVVAAFGGPGVREGGRVECRWVECPGYWWAGRPEAAVDGTWRDRPSLL